MSNLKTNIMIYNGYLKIVEETGKPPKCVDIKFDDDIQEKLNKLVDKQYDLSSFGLNIVDYACSKNGKLYKILETRNDIEDDIRLLEFYFNKNGSDFSKFNNLYNHLNYKKLYKIISIINSSEIYDYYRKEFDEKDLELIIDYKNNLSDNEKELIDNYNCMPLEEQSKIYEDYLFTQNKICYGYCINFGDEIGILEGLKDNELVDGKDGRLKFWINGAGCVSLGGTFGFPYGFAEENKEFDQLYLNHFTKVITPILHKIFKLEGLE